MAKYFFTSDFHFGHKNIIRYDNRPFLSVEEMDAEIVRRWNAKVSPDDIVYILATLAGTTTLKLWRS